MSEMDMPHEVLRTVPVHEAIAVAMTYHQNGHLAAAEEIYQQVLQIVPDHPDGLHYAGVVAHQQGRREDAIDLMGRSLELTPDQADWHSNIGVVLLERARFVEAAAAFRRAIAIAPGHVNAHNNLGVALRALKKTRAAERSYRKAIRLDPGHRDAHHNLGVLLYSQRRVREAVAEFCKVITLDPRHAQSLRLLALAHSVLGEMTQAVAICERWLEEEPDSPLAAHTLAACSGQNVPVRASNAYIETTFDNFAASFDSRLATLLYRAPQMVAGMLEERALPDARCSDVLDIGCGTGLCGPLLSRYARRLVGVDLSGKMLDQARERNVYTELVKTELTAYLRSCRDEFNIIVSADTLVYFGALDDVVAAVADALQPCGTLVFTVEELEDSDAAVDHCLRPHGRYNHSRRYVERVLRAAGLEPVIRESDLRLEAGRPVPGLVVAATKPAGLVVTNA
jgi:predicted TPR repeat methyltransferase